MGAFAVELLLKPTNDQLCYTITYMEKYIPLIPPGFINFIMKFIHEVLP